MLFTILRNQFSIHFNLLVQTENDYVQADIRFPHTIFIRYTYTLLRSHCVCATVSVFDCGCVPVVRVVLSGLNRLYVLVCVIYALASMYVLYIYIFLYVYL